MREYLEEEARYHPLSLPYPLPLVGSQQQVVSGRVRKYLEEEARY